VNTERILSPGTLVKVRDRHTTGHMRCPGYLRARYGTVVSDLGVYADHEDLAYGREPTYRRLYVVEFSFAELWGVNGSENEYSRIVVELHDQWLDPVKSYSAS